MNLKLTILDQLRQVDQMIYQIYKSYVKVVTELKHLMNKNKDILKYLKLNHHLIQSQKKFMIVLYVDHMHLLSQLIKNYQSKL